MSPVEIVGAGLLGLLLVSVVVGLSVSAVLGHISREITALLDGPVDELDPATNGWTLTARPVPGTPVRLGRRSTTDIASSPLRLGE